jgi:TPR repeat protein
MRLLAECFSYGVGVRIDPAKAAELYKAADAAEK